MKNISQYVVSPLKSKLFTHEKVLGNNTYSVDWMCKGQGPECREKDGHWFFSVYND